jgi:hypothetical protein
VLFHVLIVCLLLNSVSVFVQFSRPTVTWPLVSAECT